MRYIAEINTFWIDFHSCAHGRRRDKLTRLWSNKDWRSSLQLSCDKMHPHASCRPRIVDGKLSFPTTEEAAYPWLFRERVVRLVEGIAIDSGYTVLTSLQGQVQARHLTTFQRNVFDALPREAVLRPSVAEFGRYITLGVNPQIPEFVNNLLQKLPKGSKVVSRQLLSWEMFRVEMGDKLELESWSKKGCESPVKEQEGL